MAKAVERVNRPGRPAAGARQVEELRARCSRLEIENQRLREQLLDQLAPNRNSPAARRAVEAVRRRLAGPSIEVDPAVLLAAEEPDV